MPQLLIKVQNKIAKALNDFIVCGNSDYTVKFCFDKEWDKEPIKTARFIWSNQYQDVVFEGDTCKIPVIDNATTLGIGVFAGSLKTTTPAIINCTKSVLSGLGCPSDPPDDVYNQIIEILNEGLAATSSDITALKQKHSSDITKLQNKHDTDITGLQNKHNTDITGLQNQIDNIVIEASESGDVTTEVVQARVSIDGTNHATLKTRIDYIENDTKKLEELIDIPLTYHQGYINSDGTIVTNDTVASNWKYTSVPIKKGRKYIFWTNTTASAYSAVVKKSNGTVVKIFPVGTYFGQEYIAEYEGTLYVSAWKTSNIKIKGEILPEDISNKVDFLYNTLSINNNFEWTVGIYYDSSGNKQTASQCSSMYLDVMQGEKYKINVSGTQLVYPLFLKDSAGKIIDSLPQGTYKDYIYEVTATGRLLISTFTNPERYVRRYVESDFTKKEEYLEKMTNTVPVACYGDSLTQGNQDGSGNTYPKYLATLLSNQCNVLNRGSGGDSSREIASRQGGVGLYVQPFTIPATTTAAEIFLKCAYGSNTYFFPARQNISTLSDVYINGIKGKITYSGSASSLSGEHHYYFTRSEAGDAIEITRPTLVRTTGYDSRYYTQIIWAGTNDKPTLEKLKESTIPTIDNMIKFLHTDRYLVVGLTSKSYMPEIEEVNEYMKKYYGNKFVNLRDYILEYGLEDVGITPTSQDNIDIANGEMPTSLRNDSVHFNAKGYQIVANCIYKQGKILGYWN